MSIPSVISKRQELLEQLLKVNGFILERQGKAIVDGEYAQAWTEFEKTRDALLKNLITDCAEANQLDRVLKMCAWEVSEASNYETWAKER